MVYPKENLQMDALGTPSPVAWREFHDGSSRPAGERAVVQDSYSAEPFRVECSRGLWGLGF